MAYEGKRNKISSSYFYSKKEYVSPVQLTNKQLTQSYLLTYSMEQSPS